MMVTTSSLSRAMVQSDCSEYIAAPSPETAITLRSGTGQRRAHRHGQGIADGAAGQEQPVMQRPIGQMRVQARTGGEGIVREDGVARA